MNEKKVLCNGSITCEVGTSSIPIECDLYSDCGINTLSLDVDGLSITIDVNPVLNFFNNIGCKDE